MKRSLIVLVAVVVMLSLSAVPAFAGASPSQVHIIATKYLDSNTNGTRDGGEDWLGGFTFELYSAACVAEDETPSDGDWQLIDTQTSVQNNGQADFGMHPFGWYKMIEVLTPDQVAAGWTCSRPVAHIWWASGEVNSAIWFGNYQEEPTPPVPEYPTTILLAAGLLALGGFVLFRSRKHSQVTA